MKGCLRRTTCKNYLLVLLASSLIIILLFLYSFNHTYIAWVYYPNLKAIAHDINWRTIGGGIAITRAEYQDHLRFQALLDYIAKEFEWSEEEEAVSLPTKLQNLIDRRLVYIDAHLQQVIDGDTLASEAAGRADWLIGFCEKNGYIWDELLAEFQLTSNIVREKLSTEVALSLMQKELSQAVTITEQEIAEFYAAHKEEYMLPKQIMITHVFSSEQQELASLWEDLNEGRLTLDSILLQDELLPKNITVTQEWVKQGQLSAELDMEVFAMTGGQMIGMAETREGYHIIKVEDIISPRQQALTDILAVVANDLRRVKEKDVWLSYLQQLRQKSQIITTRP